MTINHPLTYVTAGQPNKIGHNLLATFNSWGHSFCAQISASCYELRDIKSMIGNQDLLGMILFGYFLAVSPFGKDANQAKVANAKISMVGVEELLGGGGGGPS